MITAMSLTNGTLTVVLDNGAHILTARNDHPKWNEIVEAFKAGNEDALQSLISLKAVVETYSVGELSVNTTGVTYRGVPMHTVDSNRVIAFLRDGLPFKPLANYMARKMANPSARAINELYNFLEHKNMPITPAGKIIAYKGVHNDFYSVHGNKATVVIKGNVDDKGRILNTIGSVIEVERSSVDDDFRNGCSYGLHAGSLSYARGWGQRVVLVEIDPADVVSVPDDCNCQKLRCCKYKVIGEYTGPMPEHFTDEFSADDDEDICRGYGEQVDDCSCEEESCGGDCACGESCSSEQHCSCCQESDVNPAILIPSSKMVVEARCRKIVAEVLGIDPSIIKPDSHWVNDLGADSLDGIEIIMGLEEEFSKEIGDNDAEDLAQKPFSSTVDYIYGLVTETPVSSNEKEDTYLKGMQAGVQDRAEKKTPVYLQGDQSAADSDLHAKYIEGYLAGYA